MALATASDVSDVIGRALTSEEEARCEPLLAVASRMVASQTGRRFEPGSYTIGRKVRRGRVGIPAKNPTIDAVRSVDGRTGVASAVAVDDWSAHGETLYVSGRGCFVEVDFTVTEPVPDDIVAVVAGAVGGLLTTPAAGVTSESAGPYQVTFGNNSGRIFFSASDQAVINSYRIPTPAVNVL